MATGISSLGVGAGMDLSSILSKLMAAERQPLNTLESKIISTNSKLSTYGQLQAALEKLKNAANKFSSAFNLSTASASTGDKTIATATAAFNASIGSYSLNVTQLAAAQKSFSNAITAGTTFGQGMLEFDFSGTIKTVDLSGQASYTLQEVAGKINDAAIGITATVVSGTAGDRLVLTGSSTGADGSFTLSSTDGTITPPAVSLSQLASFDTTTPDLARSTAQDAAFTIDGIAATSGSNTVTSAVAGLTINLLKTGTTTVTVENDSSKVTDAVQAFVDAYNAINTLIKDNSSYDVTSKRAKPLNGDATIRNIQSALTGVRTTVPAELAAATYQTLAEIGVSVQQDGSLKLDSSKLSSAMTTSSKDVLKTLNAYGTAFNNNVGDILGSGGIVQSRIDGLNSQITQYNSNKTSLQVRIDGIEKRYRAQFTALDRLMSSLQTTSSYLAQQLSSA
ncbi:MAG TPA: flagellar filament capping protein FliD [Azospira sp.]|nr:flagellar filament capping protein FliD [Azospira sp.]